MRERVIRASLGSHLGASHFVIPAALFVISTLFTGAAIGGGVTYKGLAEGNPDLTGNPRLEPGTEQALYPSRPANVYHGLARGNRDLVSPIWTNRPLTIEDPDRGSASVYHGLAQDNQDLVSRMRSN